MLLNVLVIPFAFLYYLWVKKREKALGYRLELHANADTWVNGEMLFDMTSVWKRFGQDAIGVNYFTIGKVENGVSSRFNPQSDYFQAWLGGYIVTFTNPKKWNVNDHFNLGISDQKNWLSLYGDPNPYIEFELDKIQELGKININNYHGMLYKGGGWSNTDVGNGRKAIPFYFVMAAFSRVFKQSNPDLQLNTNNLIPQWKKDFVLKPYQKVRADGYIAIIEITEKTKVILYVNGVNFIDSDGKKHDTFTKLHDRFLKDLQKIKIVKV